MAEKLLLLIGNSHIDPVWLWTWEEGMQEVKATFASALDRMNEYEDFCFTSTSAAFFKWIEKTVPAMFEEIKKRVSEGRWELTGGWFIEPDCILPCGEAFVRQGLYAQRYFKAKFGKTCRIGSNVDSFGHGSTLPQILKKSGMDAYVFMRPRLDMPVFVWESDDGSRVNALSLPAEYTTWFHEPTVKNIRQTLERTPEWPVMACCYGVGNHGGGPTKENIESIKSLENSFPDTILKLSTFGEFFKSFDKNKLTTLIGPFEKVNAGCYSVDSPIKKMNRMAEKRLIAADKLMALAKAVSGKWMPETGKMQELWETVLFNQFHDTLGGTSIKKARDEAVMQFSSVCAGASVIHALAVQKIANSMDTRGEGFPLFLFNIGSTVFESYVNIELEWFCQDALSISDAEGNEVPYQRIATDTKIKHTTLGGRRRVIFKALIPPCGFAVYRLHKKQPVRAYENKAFLHTEDNYCLENEHLKVEFDKVTGMLKGLWDKANNYNPLTSPMEYQVWLDERDSWGHDQGRAFGNTGEGFRLRSIDKIEKGPLRQTIRAVYQHRRSILEQLYHLYAGEKDVVVVNRLFWDKPWHMFKMAIPMGMETPVIKAEVAYGTLERRIRDKDEYYMHAWMDVTSENSQAGCLIANDSKYAFNVEAGKVQLTVLRSAIYAQGQSPDWYNPRDSFQFSDLGEHEFTFAFRPHGEVVPVYEAIALANKIGIPYHALADNCHYGEDAKTRFSMAYTDCPQIQICLIKKAEDDEEFIVRLLETEGETRKAVLTFMDIDYPITMAAHEIKTLKIDPVKRRAIEVNLIEWQVQ